MNAEEWNARYPVGTPVVAYPSIRPEHAVAVAYREAAEAGRTFRSDTDPCTRLETTTRTPAWTLGHGEPVVSVEGYAGGIALTHVDVVVADPVTAPLSRKRLAEIRAELDRGVVVFSATEVDELLFHAEWQRGRKIAFARTADRYRNALRSARRRARGLRTRVAELEAAELTVFRASHDESGIGLGHYAGRQAAMDHVHAVLANEESTTAAAIELRVIWRADDPEAHDTAWECWMFDTDGADDKPTGYVVSPITVAAAYDPDGDE